MGFEEKTPNLLALFTTHAGGSSPAVAMVTWPPTPAATYTSLVDVGDKKRKRAQEGKSNEGNEEGEITQSSHQPLTKEAQTGKGQSKKSTSTGTSKEARKEQPKKAPI